MSLRGAVRQREATPADVYTRLVAQSEEWPTGGGSLGRYTTVSRAALSPAYMRRESRSHGIQPSASGHLRCAR